MEQLLKEAWEYAKRKYSWLTLWKFGLREDEDMARLLKDHREDINFNYKLIIDNYIEQSKIEEIFDIEEV